MGLGPGETFGRYRVEKVLGRGGMGRVVAAFDTVLERKVALKAILPESADRKDAVARFLREGKLMARLSHPNAIHIYDLGEIDGVVFIAMERIDGVAMNERIKTKPPVSLVLKWLVESARGLHAAHVAGVVHRDFKSTNVMIDEHDVAKVVDFGLAKRVAVTPAQRETFHTRMGFVVGTPSYIAPELFLELEPDGRADQFSWGVTAYVSLARRDPHASDPSQVGKRIALDKLVDGISPEVARVIEQTMSIDRDQRLPSMELLANELQRMIAQPAPVVKTEPTADLHAAAISADGGRIVTLGRDAITVHEKSGRRVLPLSGLESPRAIRAIAFADDNTLVFGGAHGVFGRIDVTTGVQERAHLARDATFHAIDASARSFVLAGTSLNGPGVIAHVSGKTSELRTCPHPLRGIARASTGHVYVCGASGLLAPIDENGHPHPLSPPLGGTLGFLFASGGVVLAGGEEGIVRITSKGTPELTRLPTRIVAIASHRKRIWAGGADGSLFAHEDREWKVKKKCPAPVVALRVTETGVVAVLTNGSILRS